MQDIHHCVICGASLDANRKYVDTCGERCYRALCLATAERWS